MDYRRFHTGAVLRRRALRSGDVPRERGHAQHGGPGLLHPGGARGAARHTHAHGWPGGPSSRHLAHPKRHDVDVRSALLGAVLLRTGSDWVPKDTCVTPSSLQGEYRAGGRVHTLSRVAPPVGRRQAQLPQGSSTHVLRACEAGACAVGRAGGWQVFLPTIMELLGRRQAERVMTAHDSITDEDLLPCERKEREGSGSIPLMFGQV